MKSKQYKEVVRKRWESEDAALGESQEQKDK